MYLSVCLFVSIIILKGIHLYEILMGVGPATFSMIIGGMSLKNKKKTPKIINKRVKDSPKGVLRRQQ